jgi:DnaJ-class molecular chaperone
MDYYQVLGVSSSASKTEIRSAYRTLAFKYHPDRNADNTDAADRMKQINEAYAVLSDDAKKSRYDAIKNQYGDTAYTHFRSSYTDQDIFKGSDIRGIFEELARDFGFRNFNDLFSDIYGTGFKSFEFTSKGMSGRAFVFSGPLFKRKTRAPKDKTIGSSFPGQFLSGMVHKIRSLGAPKPGKDLFDNISLSPKHATEGGPYAYLLKESGTKLLVKIPPGVRNRQKIRLAGMGKAGINGGPPGNLYLRISIKRTLFERIKDGVKRIRSCK